jgi:hypothetical protein
MSTNVTAIDARASINRCHNGSSVRISALVCSYVRLGRPSMR